MKFISWNVNGLRACVGKGFEESFNALDADFFCLQETKMQAGQLDLQFDGYRSYWNYAEKKGYSGTAIYTRHEPLSAAYGIGIADHDTEGRVITLEYDTFYLVTVYVPNSQDGLRRLDYRMSWEDDFRAYLKGLDSKKPVVVCGDMNVAHREIDLKNPKTNRRNAGFTDEERGKMTELLDAGFTKASNNRRCYVLIGYRGDTFEKAQARMGDVWRAGFMPFAMLYRDQKGDCDKTWRHFQREWANPTITACNCKKYFGE